jgi:glycosyltransferase involved in cell wall biosynthesis
MSAYAAADVFCLPSAFHETWGIVVNEAMNFSLPIVVSEKVGSARDLVWEGENGHIVPVGNSLELARALANLVANSERRLRYGQRSREIISQWSVGIAVEGLITAAAAASGRGLPPQLVATGT